VSKTSAVLPGDESESIGLHADHRTMVRYSSRNSSSYEMVVGHLVRSARSASESIANNWANYDDLRG
jgi:hypothetical protein